MYIKMGGFLPSPYTVYSAVQCGNCIPKWVDLEHSTVIGGYYLTACLWGEEGSVWRCRVVWWENVELIKHMHRAAQGRDLLHELPLHLVYIQFGAVQLRKKGEERG